MTNKSKPTDQRVHWFDDATQAPVIDQHARKLKSFLEAVADGRVDEHEVEAQEARVYALMKEIEPQLDDDLHAKVTELLCELTAYDLMQMLNQMRQSRPKTAFHG
jgi:hypothetical protein